MIKIFTEYVLPEAIIGKILSVFFVCFFLGSLLAISSYLPPLLLGPFVKFGKNFS